jgi:hypothetical protein
MNTTDSDRQSSPGACDDSASVRIELLSAPECPNVAATRKILVDCLAELGLNAPVIEHAGRYRSPTVLINGVDVMSPVSSDQVDGDACRLDIPQRDDVLAAINATLSRRATPLTIQSLRDATSDGTAARAAALPEPVRELHRRVLHAFLATGRAPDLPALRSLADSVGGSLPDGLRRLADLDLVHCGEDGRVLVAYPFSGKSTQHSVRLSDTPAVDAMCAIDALGIPLMTNQDAMITSVDPATQQVIRVRRHAGQWLWEPATTVVLLAQTVACGPAAECPCPSITFHIDSDHAHHHLTQHPELRGSVLGQQEAIEIARLSFGSLLTA